MYEKNSTKKFFATLLSAAMILTSTGVSMIDGAKADAAGKAVLKQAKKTVSIRRKKTTLKIKKKNIKKVRKIIWTSKNKKDCNRQQKRCSQSNQSRKDYNYGKSKLQKQKVQRSLQTKEVKIYCKSYSKEAAATKRTAVSKTPAATANPAPAATAVPSDTGTANFKEWHCHV